MDGSQAVAWRRLRDDRTRVYVWANHAGQLRDRLDLESLRRADNLLDLADTWPTIDPETP